MPVSGDGEVSERAGVPTGGVGGIRRPSPPSGEEGPGDGPAAVADSRFLGMSRKQLTFVATVVVPILAAVGGAVGGVLTYWPQGEDPGVAADRVSACMRQHDLDKAETVTITPSSAQYRPEPESPIETRVFRRCEWPPSTGADPDGYIEFTADLVVAVPRASEAEAVGWADRITAPCDRVRLYYTYASQGQQDREPPLVVDVGEMVVRVSGERFPADQQLPFYFGRSEAVVLRNSKVLLDDVQCAEQE